MKFRVIIEKSFTKLAKRLARKYPSFPADLLSLVEELESDPFLGTSLGGNLRKIRLAIRSKGKGKSAGARVITYIYLEGSRVHLLAAYDKSDRDSISDDELSQLVSEIKIDQ